MSSRNSSAGLMPQTHSEQGTGCSTLKGEKAIQQVLHYVPRQSGIFHHPARKGRRVTGMGSGGTEKEVKESRCLHLLTEIQNMMRTR